MTHRDADRAIGRSRDRTDEQTDKERAKSDRGVMSTRADAQVSRATERKDSDRLLRVERARSDQVIEAERQRADQATDIERSEIEAAQREFFQKERTHTDRDLSRERMYADIDTKRAATALGRAIAAHDRSLHDLATRDEFLALLANDLRLPLQQIAVSAAYLRASRHLRRAGVDDQGQVETISRHAHEVLRFVGDLLERVELWQPAATVTGEAGGRRSRSARTSKPSKPPKGKKQLKKAKPAPRAKKRTKSR